MKKNNQRHKERDTVEQEKVLPDVSYTRTAVNRCPLTSLSKLIRCRNADNKTIGQRNAA